MTGKTIGKYRILGRLGSGGMGTVYEALDETLERQVAIKVLNRGLSDPAILRRFRTEATTLAKLNHPAIATIYELFQCEEELLIVMEFVRGETLEELTLRQGLLTLEQAVFVVDRVLSALAHTHRAGIVHCDIKPANIMITVQGGVKMMDFGTARARGTGHEAAQRYMIGTPAYMPPEQLLGHELDSRTDVYAVGVLFYRLLTGTFPFTGGTPIEAMRKQIADAPTPALARRPDLPEWTDRIVQRALAKLPADRFQTVEEFRRTLRDASGIATTELTRAFMAPMIHLAEASREPTIVEHLDAVPRSTAAAPAVRLIPAVSTMAAFRVLRSAAARPMIGLLLVVVPLVAMTTLRAPSSDKGAPIAGTSTSALAPVLESASADIVLPRVPPPLPPPAPARSLPRPELEPERLRERKPETPIRDLSSEAFAFQARVVAGDQKSSQECRCRVVLANGRISWRAEDDHRPAYAVPYTRVASMVYSRGRDPLWNGPDGPTPVVRASHGAFGTLGFLAKKDWVSLRVTDSRLQFVILRFDNVAQAASAIDALEEQTGRRIERLSKRQS
jgi:serine/threonine-protein kinase